MIALVGLVWLALAFVVALTIGRVITQHDHQHPRDPRN